MSTENSTLVQIRVVGIGVNKTITVEDGTPLADTLAEAKVAAEDGGLQVRVNGEPVDADFVPQDGDTIVVVPPAVKLG